MNNKPALISLLEALRKKLNDSDIPGAHHILDLLYAETDESTITRKNTIPIRCE